MSFDFISLITVIVFFASGLVNLQNKHLKNKQRKSTLTKTEKLDDMIWTTEGV